MLDRVARIFLSALVLCVAIAIMAPAHARASDYRNRDGACTGVAATAVAAPIDSVWIAVESGVPAARDILRSARAREGTRLAFAVSPADREGHAEVDIRLDDIRELNIPQSLSNSVTYDDNRAAAVVADPRSAMRALWRVDEATVAAADLAYEVKEIRAPDLGEVGLVGRLDPKLVRERLPGYDVVAIYLDEYSGFKAAVFERQKPSPGYEHRIYAIAGTQVFTDTDFRDWAAGLTMARAQMVATGALKMIADAAAYAGDTRNGGEVLITGQSQGALTAQGMGFILQDYLDASPAPHHLVHVVSWGAAGAKQAIATMIHKARAGDGRDIPAPFERHMASTDPDYAGAMAVWERVAAGWRALDAAAVDAHIGTVAKEMRVVGYFFAIDPFARAGTFLGTSLVFPTLFVMPDGCEALVSELMFATRAGNLGITLEAHFINGYARAVERGALAVARPAEPEKWPWVLDLLPTAEVVGRLWLGEIYRDTVLSSAANWKLCTAARQWRTDRNSRCQKGYWPGCSPESGDKGGEATTMTDDANWCLIEDGPAPTMAAMPERVLAR